MNQTAIDRYAVMGNPIAHSKSPIIHAQFAAQTGQNLQYDAMLVDTDGFASALHQFIDEGGKGLNVTVPFKEQAWQFVDKRSTRAELAGAVNTIVIHPDGTTTGDNTDGLGLVRDITVNHEKNLKGKKILIVGAGGAVRGVLQPLSEQAPAQIVVANRTVAKAQRLRQEFSDVFALDAVALEDKCLSKPFDVVINGTAAGLDRAVPDISPVAITGAFCYDMMYGTEPTAFTEWALANQAANAVDGLGMLVEQAAESFQIWRGIRPDSASVIAYLNAQRR